MNFKQSDLLEHSDACCSALPVDYRPSIDPSKTKHTAFPFRLPDKRIQQSIFCPVTSNPPRDLMAFHWWPPPRRATQRDGEKEDGRRKGGGEGR